MAAYILHTPASPNRLLQARSLSELAELIECALHAGDRIDWLGAIDVHERRAWALQRSELHQLLLLLGD